MKHEKALTILAASFYAGLLSIGVTGCLITAFDLPMTHGRELMLLWILSGCLSAAGFSFRNGWLLPGCLLALAAGYLWRSETGVEPFLQLIHRISVIYDRAYHWGILPLTDSPWYAGSADIPMGLLGLLLSMLTAYNICRRRSAAVPVTASLIPLISCVVVTDTVPAERYLILVMAGIVLLLLTSSVRQESGPQSLRLTAAALLPVFAGISLLFLAIPQEDYVNQSKELQQSIVSAVRELPRKMDAALNTLAGQLRDREPPRVDLSAIGPRIPQTHTVMEVTSGESGSLYLRGQDYDGYTGLGWTAGEGRREVFTRGTVPAGTVTIETTAEQQIFYLPYYPAEETLLTNGFHQNTDRQRRYTLTRGQLPENWRQIAHATSGEEQPHPPMEQYLALPEATRLAAQAYLQDMLPIDAGNTAKADLIAALVTDCAEYDLNTSPMPAEAEDFALWFLRESDTGYCVHFATAAVVLLRAAEIPARYVSGYLLEAVAGQTIAVTEANAHAWAEYYEPRLDAWLPLEVTPARERPPVILSGVPVPTSPETEPSTEAATLPPPESTVPNRETEPVPTQTAAPEPEPSTPTSGPGILLWLLLPLTLLGAEVQRKLRLHLRRVRLQTGTPNQRALFRWQETERLARRLKEAPPEDLLELARKAKFSPHTLTGEELQHFDRHHRSCLKRLKEKPWYARVIYRYVYALY